MTGCLHTALQCLVAVGRHHGLDLNVERLVHEHAMDQEPTADHLAEIARTVSLQAKTKTLVWADLARLALAYPIIAHLKNGNSVIILAYRQNGEQGEVVVLDPLAVQSGFITLPQNRFEVAWSGEVVFITRRYSLNDPDQPFGLRWFMPEILRQKPFFIDVAISALVLHGIGLGVPIFFQVIIDKVLVHENYQTLYVLVFGVAMTVMVEAVMSYLRSFLLLHATTKIDMRISLRTFGHMLSLPISFFQRSSAGVLTKHMQQVSTIREFLTGRLLLTLLDSTVLLVFIPILFYYSGMLTAVVLVFSLLMAGMIALLVGPYQQRLRHLYQAEGERQSLLVETIHGIGTVKSLALEPRQSREWEMIAAHAIERRYNVGKISLGVRTISSLLEKMMTIGVVGLGAILTFDHRITVGELVAFQMLAGRVSGPLVQLAALVNEFQEAALSVRMLGLVMNQPSEQGNDRGLRPVLQGNIIFEDVTFSYPGMPTPALDHISLTIPAGSTIALVGRSGSGKTTLARLVQGLYTMQSGMIRYDGYDLREIDLVHLRRNIGVVLQDPFLFRGTVRENIAVTRTDATFEDIVEMARIAGAEEFVQRLPQGYDTILEEGATNLSGGQKQRLSIARALLRKPPILVLDEATSALDPDSEALVVAGLRKISQGRTTIIISHRLTTIRHADLIVVMEQGRIVEAGSHNELMGKSEVYRQLWMQQTKGLI